MCVSKTKSNLSPSTARDTGCHLVSKHPILHVLNNQCIMVQSENNLPRCKSLAITALRNVSFFHHPDSSCSPSLDQKGSNREGTEQLPKPTPGPGSSDAGCLTQSHLRGKVFVTFPTLTAKEVLPHQSLKQTTLKMKSATYLLSILISREAALFLKTKMINMQNSFILQEVISFQK